MDWRFRRLAISYAAIAFGALLAVQQPLTAEESSPSQPTVEQIQFFESRVRPILHEHCFSCHGTKKQWAGLRLDSYQSIIRGGDSGPAAIPAKPNESLFVKAIRHDGDLKMPQDGKLSDPEISTLVRWVEMGLPFPAANETTGKAPAGKKNFRDPNHWSFSPVIAVTLPNVRDPGWCSTEIDRFVLHRLEAESVRPSNVADKVTLLRRLTFNLVGLPPTPDELDTFLADDGPDADSRLIDRLLGSPAFGERWGRHWLDVARYADSNGLDENIAQGNAWRYRDYVVNSVNRDKPFNQFVVEQISGDLLPAKDQAELHEFLTATGYLSIGPKVLAEVDGAKMRMDIVDEQIETVGRSLLGMSFGCARCHDHKFDPIDTADYYGLAGIFKSTKTMDTYTKVAKWHEHVLPSEQATSMQREFDDKVAAKKKEIEAFVAKADEQARSGLAADQKPPEKLETIYPDATKAELAKLREQLAAIEKSPPNIPSVMGVTEDAVADVAVHIRGNPLKLGDVVPRRMPPVFRGPAERTLSSSNSGRRELAEWLVDPRHPLTTRVLANRVWNWHLGKGLIRSVDNFGMLGERPSHPELLDWLAKRIVDGGWSLKSLHRDILLSTTYRLSSDADVMSLEADPENLLFGRSDVRRIDAESIRDTLLMVGNELDRSFGGTLLAVKNRDYLFDHTSIDKTDYTSRRRSLYLPVIRNNVYDLFQLLDFPDPAVSTGARSSTTVAPQALMMMNSPFVMDSANHFATRLLAETLDDQQRVRLLARVAFGREPTGSELQSNLAFVQSVNESLAKSVADPAERERQSWGIVCHVALASNEFIYLK